MPVGIGNGATKAQWRPLDEAAISGLSHQSFLSFLIFIGVELIYNIVLVPGVQQSELVIHIHVSTLF